VEVKDVNLAASNRHDRSMDRRETCRATEIRRMALFDTTADWAIVVERTRGSRNSADAWSHCDSRFCSRRLPMALTCSAAIEREWCVGRPAPGQ
jgi:hypothetical protein